jgi:hypothetical protein
MKHAPPQRAAPLDRATLPRAARAVLWIKWPAVGYVVIGLAYVVGGALLGAGIYLVMSGNFPGWWKRRMLWPLVRVTPTVAHLQGWAFIGLGASVLAIGFSGIVSEIVGGGLVLLAMVAYVVGAGLFVYSTWLSRRLV